MTKLGGMLWGDRLLNLEGTMIFEDKANQLKAVIILGQGRYDKFTGKIYRNDPSSKYAKKEPSKMSEIKDIAKEICDVSGSVLENLLIGGQEYWNIETMLPMKALPIPNALPSDPRYREDLIWLKRENESFSQTWKTRLEIQQRHERKLRIDSKQRLDKR